MSEVCFLEKARVYIYAMDFTMMINKMVNHGNWREKDALKTEKLYKNFLFLNRKYGDFHSLPPSEDIDEFWHNHILDTERYHQDCQIIFGKYVHHYPYFGIDEHSTLDDLDNAFEKTQELHFKEFGEYIYSTRSANSKFLNFFLLKK